MLKRAFGIFSRSNSTNKSSGAISTASNTLSPSEIISKAQEKAKDPKCDALKPIVWIDCEMTGLDHQKDSIIEICCLITDKDLKLIDEEGYESVIHQDHKVMDSMNEWCVNQHGKSGLTEKVIKSTKTKEEVEAELLEYLKKYMNPGVGILAGNSVHMDRLFMLKDMPKVVDYLTYRIIDVSSIMEIAKRFHPLVANSRPRKRGAHTSRADILESIQDLEYYRGTYFRGPNEATATTIKEFLKTWPTPEPSNEDDKNNFKEEKIQDEVKLSQNGNEHPSKRRKV